MNRYIFLLSCAVVVSLAAPNAAGAAPKLKASPSLKAGRLVVTLTSKQALTPKTRPRSVSVASGAATYKLKRVSSAKRKSVWRSKPLAAGQLAALGGKQVRIRVKTRAGALALKRSVPAAAPAPGPGGGTAPAPPAGGGAPGANPPGLTLTRDDAAGRQALAGGDLLLERTESGNAVMTYRRLFLYANGLYRFEKADWNSVSGEICDSEARREGSWAFKEGYTFPERGGGVVVKLAITTGGQTADDVLAFANQDPGNVYVGTDLVPFERNPNMRDQC